MKRLLIILLSIVLAFSLCGCGKSQSEEALNVPPGLSVIQKQLKMTKHSEKGENAAFTKAEFTDFLGEDMTYITVNDLPEGGILVCNGAAVLKGQTISADSLGYLKFVPNSDCTVAAFNFSCDSNGYHGNQIRCEMVFSNEADLSPVAGNSVLETVSGISCHGQLDITEPNGDRYTVNIVTYPSDGYVSIDNGALVYTPESGFSGKDKLVYTVTDYFGNVSDQATVDIKVSPNQSGIVFADMQENENHLFAHEMCSDNIMVYRMENGEYYFDPQSSVTKSEFLVMLMCVSGLDKDVTAVADSIITDDNGLSTGIKGYISAAAEQEIIKLDNGKFNPMDAITLSDAAYMVTNALGLPINVSSSQGDADNSISAMISAGLTDITDGTQTLTKEACAKILCGVSYYIEENNIQK